MNNAMYLERSWTRSPVLFISKHTVSHSDDKAGTHKQLFLQDPLITLSVTPEGALKRKQIAQKDFISIIALLGWEIYIEF